MNTLNNSIAIYWVICVNITFLIATLLLLKKGKANQKTIWIFGIISAIWIFFIHTVLSQRLFIPEDISGKSFYEFTLYAATLLLTVFYLSPLKKIFTHIPQEYIQMVQGLRVFVAAGFLMEGVLKIIPAWFLIMDGFLHATSGFLALIASIAVVKNHNSKIILLWCANIVGVLDILIIVTSICFVVWDDVGAFHNMQYVVFYTGVLLLWFHFASISKLIKTKNLI